MHDFVGEDYSINSPFWSIAVEWRIYFLFPLLVWLWRWLGPWKAAAISVIGSLVLCFVLKAAIGRTLTAGFIGLFALGMLATTLSFSTETPFTRLRQWRWDAISFGVTLLLVLVSVVMVRKGQPQSLLIPTDEVVGLWAMTLLVWIARGNNWARQILSWKPLVWVGTFAYSIYLIHSPLIQLLWQFPFAPLQKLPVPMFLLLAGLGIPLMLGIAYIFFLACERPFMRTRKT